MRVRLDQERTPVTLWGLKDEASGTRHAAHGWAHQRQDA